MYVKNSSLTYTNAIVYTNIVHEIYLCSIGPVHGASGSPWRERIVAGEFKNLTVGKSTAPKQSHRTHASKKLQANNKSRYPILRPSFPSLPLLTHPLLPKLYLPYGPTAICHPSSSSSFPYRVCFCFWRSFRMGADAPRMKSRRCSTNTLRMV